MIQTQSAEPTTPFEELLETLSPYEQFVVVIPDDPDADALASGWAFSALLEETLHRPILLLSGKAPTDKAIRHMIEMLFPPIEFVKTQPENGSEGIVLVDGFLGEKNHLLARTSVRPAAVIDCHLSPLSVNVAFCDIRPSTAATTSIIASYFQERQIEPAAKLATAMLYAIRQKTKTLIADQTLLDKPMMQWLNKFADKELVQDLERN